MSKKAPLENLHDIEVRKQQLRAKIELQERKLSEDLDAYQDDIETLKKTWGSLKNVRNFGQNFSVSGISQAVKALPLSGKSQNSKSSRLMTVFTLGAEVVSWIIQRRKRKKGKK